VAEGVDAATMEDINYMANLEVSASWTKELGERIVKLWAHPVIKKLFNEDRNSIHGLTDGAGYLFDRLGAILKEEHYIPTEADIFRIRVRTSGYEEAAFEYNGKNFRIWDVGGQRSERRHWRKCLQGATGIIFCASLVEYDQVLREDSTRNRMEETVLVWEEISRSSLTKDMALILLLNKSDLLKDKVKKHTIKSFFKDYTGPDTFDESANYIKQYFLSKVVARDVFPHIICAVDTDNVKLVWQDIRENIVLKLSRATASWM